MIPNSICLDFRLTNIKATFWPELAKKEYQENNNNKGSVGVPHGCITCFQDPRQ